MKKYYVKNGKVVVNKYCVQYVRVVDNGDVQTVSEVCQYLKNNDELRALTEELNFKGIEYTATELEVSDILKFDGALVGSEEEARKLIEPTLEEVKAGKIKELTAVCQETIFNGIDVTLTSGETKHFSLKIEDQMNLNSLFAQVSMGAIKAEEGVPYHADGEICSMFNVADFTLVANTASAFKLQQTTYCNHLMLYIRTLTSKEDVEAVTYGQKLTGEFLESYNKLIGVVVNE